MKRILLLLTLGMVLAATPLWAASNYVEPDQFKQWLESGKIIQIIDIQVPADFQKHHFKGSIETNAYPVKSADDKQKLDKAIPQLSSGQEDIVVICPRGGGGAKNAYDYLKEKGIAEKRLFILEDGMQGWLYKQLTVSDMK
jgi:rhodanese-related sulfurtransferase